MEVKSCGLLLPWSRFVGASKLPPLVKAQASTNFDQLKLPQLRSAESANSFHIPRENSAYFHEAPNQSLTSAGAHRVPRLTPHSSNFNMVAEVDVELTFYFHFSVEAYPISINFFL